jgi:hypothetical protein
MAIFLLFPDFQACFEMGPLRREEGLNTTGHFLSGGRGVSPLYFALPENIHHFLGDKFIV